MFLWIPRGRLYHSFTQSIKYFFWTLYKPLEMNTSSKNSIEKKFADYVGVKYCRIFPSARIALYFSIKALNLPHNTRVLMPPITIKPILDVIYSLGLKPKFVDLNLDDFTFDIDDLHSKIESDTRVILLTYLFGQVPNIEKIRDIAAVNSIYLIEDFSQALGADFKGKKLGSFGDISIYSASSIKTLDTLGGGFAVTNDITFRDKLSNSQKSLEYPNRSIIIRKAFTNLYRNIVTYPVIFSIFTINFLKFLRKLNLISANRMTGGRSKAPLSKLPKKWFTSYTQIQLNIFKEQIINLDNNISTRVNAAKHVLDINYNNKEMNSKRDVYWQLCVISTNPRIFLDSALVNKIDLSQTSLSLISSNLNYPDHLECPNATIIYENSFLIPCYPQLTHRDLSRLSTWYKTTGTYL